MNPYCDVLARKRFTEISQLLVFIYLKYAKEVGTKIPSCSEGTAGKIKRCTLKDVLVLLL